MSKEVKEYITLFEEFFDEISKEELSAILSKIESRKYNGITVSDYLNSLDSNIDVLKDFYRHNEIITHFENSEHKNAPIPSSLTKGVIKGEHAQSIELGEFSTPVLLNDVQEFSSAGRNQAYYFPGGDNYGYRLAA